MNSYRIIAYIRYWLRAKTRHGVHSPFVFAFIENVLNAPQQLHKNQAAHPLHNNILSADESALETRIDRYFNIDNMLLCMAESSNCAFFERSISENNLYWLAHEATLPTKEPGFFIEKLSLYAVQDPAFIQRTVTNYLPFLQEQSIIVMHDIHANKKMAAAWQQLCDRPEVTLSIDIFSMGLLFFRHDFKVKQHFILKNPCVRL